MSPPLSSLIFGSKAITSVNENEKSEKSVGQNVFKRFVKINIPANHAVENSAKDTQFEQKEFFLIDSLKCTLYYIAGLLLLTSLVFAVVSSWFLRCFVRLIFKLFYKGQIKLIERGADACWAVETGIGASGSNIVIGLKCIGLPELDTIMEIFDKRVLNLRTDLTSKPRINEESDPEIYEPYEKLRWIVTEKFLLFCWKKDPEFSIKNHFAFEEINSDDNLDRRVQSICEHYLGKRLSRCKPQWRVRIISRRNNGFGGIPEYAIIFCIHHTYGDGMSWLQMLRYAFADKPFKVSMELMPQSTGDKNLSLLQRLSKGAKIIFLFPHHFATQIMYMCRESNAFHYRFVKKNKTCRWTNTLSLNKIKCVRLPVAQEVGNDSSAKPAFTGVVMSCLTSAFTQSYLDCKAQVPFNILASVPYVVLPYESLRPLNHFYVCLLPFPTHEANSAKRLAKSNAHAKSFNPPIRADINLIVSHMCGTVITPLQKLMGISARATLALSNLPGPVEKMTVCNGHDVTNLMLFPPMKFRTGIVIGLFSYMDKLNMSITVDHTLNSNPSFVTTFLHYVEQELEHLVQNSGENLVNTKMTPSLTRTTTPDAVIIDINNNKSEVTDDTCYL